MSTALQDQISDADFQAIRQLVYDHFGINLTERKKTLLVGRLQKVLSERAFPSFRAYYDWLLSDRSGEGLAELANRISTNHTYFYREPAHFDYFLGTVLPSAVARREAAGDIGLRVWCAGCSSGEEPYTLMMLMMDFFGNRIEQWRPALLATDISATALRTALKGTYDREQVAELPATLRRRYFQDAGADRLEVTADVRPNIVFRHHNLMDARFPFRKLFDVIFCRNVMIYFDRDTRNNLVSKFYRHTAPGGHLFTGHSEALRRGETAWENVKPAVYIKNV